MTWNTSCDTVLNKQRLSTISTRKCNNCVGPVLHNSLPKYLRDIESVKNKKFEFELNKFLKLIPNETKMPNCVTAERDNSIVDLLSYHSAQGIHNSAEVSDIRPRGNCEGLLFLINNKVEKHTSAYIIITF